MDMDQHFLVNKSKIAQMMDALEIGPEDRVLELGAGMGTVSRHVPRCRSLTLVEKDAELCGYLIEQFQFDPDVQIICDDARLVLPEWKADKILSCLPWDLTPEILAILAVKPFSAAVMCVRKGDSHYSDFGQLDAQKLCILDKSDFSPAQNFASEALLIRHR